MTTNGTMRAIVFTEYGPPDVLQLKVVEKPAPKSNEVLIRIYAATVNATDPINRKGEPFISRLFTGLTSPKNPIPGTELAGEIEAVGVDVKLYKQGDQIIAQNDFGAYAEYICLPEEGALGLKPHNMSYAEAAAVGDGALGAVVYLRDKANIQIGQDVLINGASGGLGTAAVQLAKYFGANVTGVCSTTNIELVKSLGADEVIDYTREDFTKTGHTYDLIFDAVSKSSFSHCKGSLKESGVYIRTMPTMSFFIQVLWRSIIGGKKAMIAAPGMRPSSVKRKDLAFLKELIEAGKIKSIIDRNYPLEQIADAHRYVEKGHKKGNVILTMEHSNTT
ncbi:MAG: NAD(P)-dependent alcohol dehydrogenase [Anaerolineales bacterium]|nr:MAG: NAD(P)-dependent alcohol dehydrogenase [Anaerolineales bacterium]